MAYVTIENNMVTGNYSQPQPQLAGYAVIDDNDPRLGLFAAPIIPTLAGHRYAVCNGGTIINNIPVQTDQDSRSDLTAAFVLASANSGYSIQWKAGDGNFYPLNATAIIAIAGAVALFVQKCFASEATVTSAIAQYATATAAVAAFDALMAAP